MTLPGFSPSPMASVRYLAEGNEVHRINSQGWRWPWTANLSNLSWEREPRWVYPTPCPATSWKRHLNRDHTTPLGRFFPWMAVLTLKKFLSCIKMIPLLVQLVTLVFSSCGSLWKREPSSSFWPLFLVRSPLSLLFSREKFPQFFFTASIVHPSDDFHGLPCGLLHSGHFFLAFWGPEWDTRESFLDSC